MSVDSFLTSGTSPGDRAGARVAILGFGHVGSAVAHRLTSDEIPGLQLTHILDRRALEKRSAHPQVTWTTRFDGILASRADIVVELIGGLDPAADWIRQALSAGKSVVTANKQVIARDGPALLAFAARQGRQLRFEAAVGGAMPIVRAVGEGLAGDRLTRIVAILNGTANAILSRIDATGCTFSEALDEARARGWAEANPDDDLSGADARAKLAILCALAFRVRVHPSSIDARSIAGIEPLDFERARRRGATIRQLAWADYDEVRSALTIWVAPVEVPRSSLFARTVGPDNAAIISGRYAGSVGIFGAGAGGVATSVSVISDLLAIARDRAAIIPAPVLSAPATIQGLQDRAPLPSIHLEQSFQNLEVVS